MGTKTPLPRPRSSARRTFGSSSLSARHRFQLPGGDRGAMPGGVLDQLLASLARR